MSQATMVPGVPERGLWCKPCGLPSMIRIPLIILSESGVQDTGLSAWLCTRSAHGRDRLTAWASDVREID